MPTLVQAPALLSSLPLCPLVRPLPPGSLLILPMVEQDDLPPRGLLTENLVALLDQPAGRLDEPTAGGRDMITAEQAQDDENEIRNNLEDLP